MRLSDMRLSIELPPSGIILAQMKLLNETVQLPKIEPQSVHCYPIACIDDTEVVLAWC